MGNKILFVDDEWKERGFDVEFEKRLPKDCVVIYEKYGNKAVQQLKDQKDNQDIKAVLLDLNFKGQSKQGEEILRDIKNHSPALPVIILTSDNDVQKALRLCMDEKLAYYYFVKSEIDFDQLIKTVGNAIEYYEMKTSFIRKTAYGSIIGQSLATKKILESIEKVAPKSTRVLITGKSGTGKELVASAIHENSTRKGGCFITVNCAALQKDIVESELFGHVKGAFTGAINDKKGRLEIADKGTIFLDEIAELELSIQAKLLRFIEHGEIQKVGDVQPARNVVDVRIIAATHRNLKEMINNREFREDLYYRLNVFPIHIPPLSDRREDIPLLVEYIVNNLNFKEKTMKEVSKEALELLSTYDWPGNIRELRNVLESALVVSSSNVLGKECFPSYLTQSSSKKDNEDTEDNVWAEKLICGEKKWKDLKDKFKTEQQNRILKKATELAIQKKLVNIRGVRNWLADHIGIHRTALSQRIGEEQEIPKSQNSGHDIQ